MKVSTYHCDSCLKEIKDIGMFSYRGFDSKINKYREFNLHTNCTKKWKFNNLPQDSEQ